MFGLSCSPSELFKFEEEWQKVCIERDIFHGSLLDFGFAVSDFRSTLANSPNYLFLHSCPVIVVVIVNSRQTLNITMIIVERTVFSYQRTELGRTMSERQNRLEHWLGREEKHTNLWLRDKLTDIILEVRVRMIIIWYLGNVPRW